MTTQRINITSRSAPIAHVKRLEEAGVHPLLARLYAARGITRKEELDYSLKALLPPSSLLGNEQAAQILADAIEANSKLLIVADYDCDGATACAVGVRALRSMGAQISYIVPNRFEYGYGLTPAIVDLAAQQSPDVIITVDNGIASVDGVAHARAMGFTTVITDHHLPGDTLPDADVIVNPNQPGCNFASKNIAGVGVIFYVMLQLRAELRKRGWFTAPRSEPNLAELLDLVALGTVADVVKLDHNNRILVAQGLQRMRAAKVQPGIRALFAVATRTIERAATFDLGFALGPRLNAAGRLSDMSLGIECLTTNDISRAFAIAQELDTLNRERRAIEEHMRNDAMNTVDQIRIEDCAAISLYQPDWHQGVIGIVAGRIKERTHRPTIAFASAGDGTLKGSGRSIPSLHLRDALDLLSKREPNLIVKFGGHAMAAGLSIHETDFEHFRSCFERTVTELLDPAARQRCIEVDGALESAYMTLELARLLDNEIWGQGFTPPLFADHFEVSGQRLLKEKHLKLDLMKGAQRFSAIHFNCSDAVPTTIRAAYRLSVNEFNGTTSLQLMLEHWESPI